MEKNSFNNYIVSLSKWIYRRKLLALFIHWSFQGFLYADRTEKIFRLFLDVIFTLFIFIILNNLFSIGISIILSLFCAHTVNAIINGQLFVVLRNYRTSRNIRDFDNYALDLKSRIIKENSLDSAAIYGSYCRGEIKESSDLDVRIIRKRGLSNGVKSCFFGFKERMRALINRFPLDIYVIDSTKHLLLKLREDEIPIVLYDSCGLLKNLYKKIVYLEDIVN